MAYLLGLVLNENNVQRA